MPETTGNTRLPRILIVDPHDLVREGVMKILSDQPGETLFGEAGSIREALELVRDQEWDLAVLDFWGFKNGMELLKGLKNIRAKLPVLILSEYPEDQFAHQALKAGASGYVPKNCRRSELVSAVNKVMSGGTYIGQSTKERLIFNTGPGSDRPPHEALSSREFEVLRLIASGKTVGQIAEVLSLTDSTISTYRGRILDKMGMRTNAELTRYAIQNKLV